LILTWQFELFMLSNNRHLFVLQGSDTAQHDFGRISHSSNVADALSSVSLTVDLVKQHVSRTCMLLAANCGGQSVNTYQSHSMEADGPIVIDELAH
jgi:hypothetical protein